MKRASMALAGLVVAVTVGSALSNGRIDADGAAIEISPNTLNLQSEGAWVTVHSNIPYGAVVGETVALDGVSADVVKADNLGCLVAKFEIEAIQAIVAPPRATLTLTGKCMDGAAFAASDTIAVVGGRGR